MSSGGKRRHCFGGNVFFCILVILINLKISNLGHYSPLYGHGRLLVILGSQMVKLAPVHIHCRGVRYAKKYCIKDTRLSSCPTKGCDSLSLSKGKYRRILRWRSGDACISVCIVCLTD